MSECTTMDSTVGALARIAYEIQDRNDGESVKDSVNGALENLLDVLLSMRDTNTDAYKQVLGSLRYLRRAQLTLLELPISADAFKDADAE